MIREYQKENVYEALQQRFHFLFQEFENIYVSFSGGKDSGLLLNLLLDFKRQHYPERLIGMFHQDFEAQYTLTTEYVEQTFRQLEHEVDPYWVCQWLRGRRLVIMKCIGTLGMMPKKISGFGQCQSILM